MGVGGAAAREEIVILLGKSDPLAICHPEAAGGA